MTDPLKGSPKRQAAASQRGYHYQVLRTIYELLDLGAGERLYLEGAEDLDRISDERAEAVQVKHTDTATRITLRCPSVIEALNNFWRLLADNPGRAIRLSFVTNAGVGVEAGQPFGNGQSGIQLWETVARASEDDFSCQSVDRLRTFLVAETRLGSALHGFLVSASASQIKAILIDRIAWLTREPAIGDVEAAVLRKIAALCWERKVPAAYSRNVLDRLVGLFWHTVTATADRMLTTAELSLAFDEATTVHLPRGTLETIEAMTTARLGALPFGALDTGFQFTRGTVRVGAAPPLLGRHIQRPNIERMLLAQLREHGVATLCGGIGMGKSTQAIMLAQVDSPAFLWVNCHGSEPEDLRVTLAEAGRQLDAQSALRYLVLDDVEPAHVQVLEEWAPGLLYTLRRRRGGLLFTSPRPTCQRLRARLGVASSVDISMPMLNSSEVMTLLREYGLEEPLELMKWALSILCSTGGHPQLASVRIAVLADAGFPAANLDDSDDPTPAEIRDSRREARILVSTALPQEQKELLYRLSLFGAPFSRQRALAVGEITPVVKGAGDVFDRLLGRWIEPFGADLYRPSLLLFGAGQEANGAAWTREMYYEMAGVCAQFSEQSPWDVACLLLFAVIGGNMPVLAQLTQGLFCADEELWGLLAQTSSPFAQVYTAPGERFPTNSAFEQFCARFVQLQIAVRANPAACESIRDRALEELPARSDDCVTRLSRYEFLLFALMQTSATLSVAELARMVTEIAELRVQVPADRQALRSLAGIEDPQAALNDAEESTPLEEACAIGLLTRAYTYESLLELISALDAVAPMTRAQCLRLLSTDPRMARRLAERVIESETTSESPRWQLLADALGTFVEHALKWEYLVLAQALATARAQIIHEHLRDAKAAWRALNVVPMVESESALTADIRAHVLLEQGERDRAAELWDTTFEQSPADVDAAAKLARTARRAAVALAEQEDWSRSGRYFEVAATAAATCGDSVYEISVLMDGANAWFRANDRARAVHRAAHALRGLTSLPNTPTDVRLPHVYYAVRHVMKWIALRAQWESDGTDPPCPGLCSASAPSGPMGDSKYSALDKCRADFLTLAQCCGEKLSAFEDVVAAVSQSDATQARYCLAALQLNERLSEGDIHGVPAAIAHLLAELDSLRASSGDRRRDEDRTIWKVYFCKALLKLVGHRDAGSNVLRSWRKESERMACPTEILEWLDGLAQLSAQSPQVKLQTIKRAGESWTRFATAALILLDPNSDVSHLLKTHVWLLIKTELPGELALSACSAVSAAWRLIARDASSLGIPQETVPEVLQACDAHCAPRAKVARLFLVVADAVDAEVSDDLVAEVRRLAADVGLTAHSMWVVPVFRSGWQ